MDYRLPYIRSGRAGLQSNPDRETAVDVVGAAGKASATGVDLWKSMLGMERGAYFRLRFEMLRKFRERYPREQEAERVVEQAIHEFFGPGCMECEGTGMVGALGAVRATCPTCSGTRIKHYTDVTRATMMKLSFGKTKHLAFKIGWVIKELSGYSQDVNRTINHELGRE